MGTKVYYQKAIPAYPCMMGIEFLKINNPPVHEAIRNGDLSQSHTLIKDFEEDIPLEKVFQDMQGEVWSPNGEQRGYVKSLGLEHTSMMVGDIVAKDDGLWFCDFCGWVKLK